MDPCFDPCGSTPDPQHAPPSWQDPRVQKKKNRQTRYMVHLAISHCSQSLNLFVCCLAVVMQDQVRNGMRLLQRPAALSIVRRRDAN